jgi:glycosyltransferase involved in cell wall biosynthesis
LKRAGIFIVPRASTAWRGNEAGWITASGWASAAQQLWGHAIVATTDGIFTPQQSMLFPRGEGVARKKGGRFGLFRKLVPEFLITGVKDIQLKRSKPKEWPIERQSLLDNITPMIVWERHDLFAGPGARLAKSLQVPFVLSVEAPTVWEAKKWGVHRPIWGNYLEKYFESRSLQKADLVCCVTEEVQAKVISMGVKPENAIVCHNRVDSTLFHPGVSGDPIRRIHRLESNRVIGWTGSFRSFHGLDTVVKAFEMVNLNHPDTVLMLIGDGLEFESTKNLVSQLNLSQKVIFTGKKPFVEIPSYVAAFDIALVSASSAEGFHYSPLKLREYLACGKPVIAPRAGNLPEIFKDGSDLVLYEAGNARDLAAHINQLLESDALRKELTDNAIDFFKVEGTWVHELKRVCDKLRIPY